MLIRFLCYCFLLGLLACNSRTDAEVIAPLVITQRVKADTDDPAIWIDAQNPANSKIIGTDKGGDVYSGALYIYDLSGRIDTTKTVLLERPNNVDVAYGLICGNQRIDIAACTERGRNRIRIFALPELSPMDQGGIEVFVGEEQRSPMGIALYTDASSGQIYAIVGRKNGPTNNYLHQYRLMVDSLCTVSATLVRTFGEYSGTKEIESIVVDDELGYVYYSDEGIGVRKYYAHPDSSHHPLALFATTGIREDHEGLSIYKANDGTGYILLSDQQANRFHVFPREGTDRDKHDHPLIKTIALQTRESDGSEVSNVAFNGQFPFGLFVAMSDDGTFQLYSWKDLAGNELFLAPNGDKLKAD